MGFIEENEISKNSNGGTEITKRSIGKHIDPDLAVHFQIIPSRVREIEPSAIRVYWAHDLPGDPEVNKAMDMKDNFHKIVFSSHWQMVQYMMHYGLAPDDKLAVIETPIEPIQNPFPKKFDDGIRIVYFSTPHRGLKLLVPVFEDLAVKHPNIHLDVFSSFKIYGWDDPKEYQELFDRINKHDRMHSHGSVDQETLRDHLRTKAHILAYPNTWPETSCRVLMESMSAGLMCVHPNLAALPDTSGGITTMYQWVFDEENHMKTFHQYLNHAINHITDQSAQSYLQFVKAYADTRFELSKIASQWTHLMQSLLEKYPTVESRKPAEQVFRYKV